MPPTTNLIGEDFACQPVRRGKRTGLGPFLEKGVGFQRLGTTTSNLPTVISLIAN